MLLSETKVPVNKRFALGTLVRIAAVVEGSRLGRILFGQKRNQKRKVKVWRFVTESRLLGDIPFSFDAKVSGTTFQLQGPFRYAAGDYYGAYLTQGAYEPAVTAHITQVVRQCPTPRVLDVGAHYGWYTILLAKIIANRGIVFSFEPSEAIFSLLKRNVELNDLHNVRLYELPLSDKRETVSMVSNSCHQDSRYMSVIEQGAMGNNAGLLSAIPFDELNEMEAIQPNIVKIDVHGVWKKVVDGMRKSLHRDVEHLYLELDNPLGDLSSWYVDIRHIILMLRDAGMSVYEIQDFRQRHGSKIVKAEDNWIARSGNKEAMLYAVKRR